MGDNAGGGRFGRFNGGGGGPGGGPRAGGGPADGGGPGSDPRGGRGGGGNNDGQKGNTSPCPAANGTTIGTSQSFTLQCGLNIGGDVLSDVPMSSFIACVDSCASTHPRCDGVSFNGQTCRQRANANAAQTSRPSDNFDSALAIFPTSIDSRCSTLGPSMQTSPAAGSKRFDLACGKVLDGGDLLQQHTATFFDCAELCARSSACVAVSYDWSMKSGFNNCYLKNTVADLVGVQDIDTAIINRGGGGPPAQPANPAPPASSPPAAGGGNGQGVVLVPVPSASTSASSARSLPTGPNPAAPAGPSAPPARASSPATTAAIRRPQSMTAPGTPSATFATSARGPLVQTPAAGANSSAAAPAEESAAGATSSQAWIAAPVIGGVAAVAAIAVVFVIWGRRRGWIRGKSGGGGGGGAGRGTSGAKGSGGGGGDDEEWLRDAEQGAAAGAGARRGSASRSIRSSRSSISRDGSAAGSRPDSIPAMPPPPAVQTPRYEVRHGRMALSDGTNGLSQHSSDAGAVPSFLRESRIERRT